MHITNFTVKQDGQLIGRTPIQEQAVGAAKGYAQQTSRPVSVIATLDTGKEKAVIFHPDGSIEKTGPALAAVAELQPPSFAPDIYLIAIDPNRPTASPGPTDE